MSIDDNDNLYILEENEEEKDQTPLNYAAYSDDQLEESEEMEEEKEGKERSAFGMLFRIMLTPVEGWKILRRNKMTVENFQSGCFYPLLALLALSKFAEFFYSVNVSLTQVVTQAVVAFVAFFFGYFCTNMLLGILLPKDMAAKFECEFGKKYLLVALSTLALFSIITNLIPMLWPILIFLPMWTLYLMFKGTRFFHFEQKQEMRFFVTSGAMAVGVPLFIEWILNQLL